MEITLIHNPNAGSDQPSGEELIGLIRSSGHAVVYRSFALAGWERVLEEATDLVAVAGGDGVVGQAAKRLAGRRIPFTILPLGTANNIAATLGLTGHPLDQLIVEWERAPRRNFDIGVARTPWGTDRFIEGLGVGAFTDTMARLDARKNVDISHHNASEKKIRSVRQIMAFRLEGATARRLNLVLDGQDISGDYVMLEAMNIRHIGPNLCLAPNADPGDGLLDIVLIAEEERERMHRYLSDETGSEIFPRLPVVQGRRLRIECAPLRIRIDDDARPRESEPPPHAPMIVEASVQDQCLQVLLPFDQTAVDRRD